MSGPEIQAEEQGGTGRPSEKAEPHVKQGVQQKESPAALQLRAQPVRALRFKRNVLIGGFAAASIAVAATAWWALTPDRPTGSILSAKEPDAARLPSESLAGLPQTYDAVPQLGPPLPGDLGRPILKRQREVEPTVVARDEDARLRSAAAAREKAQADLRAARLSTLLAIAGGKGDITGNAESMPAALATTSAAATVEPANDARDRDFNDQDSKKQFMTNGQRESDVNSHRLEPPVSRNLLSAGSVIAASLITGLRSDLPGLVTAQVTERVYDSATGRTLLIPQGARLIGRYDSAIAYGQSRALVIWQRIIMPDGSSVRLDNAPATDSSGYAGLADKVDHHSVRLLKGVAISTLLGVGANLTFSGESDLVQAIREATQQNVSRAGDQITSRNLQVQPTITIRPGMPVRLLVHRDLILPSWNE